MNHRFGKNNVHCRAPKMQNGMTDVSASRQKLVEQFDKDEISESLFNTYTRMLNIEEAKNEADAALKLEREK